MLVDPMGFVFLLMFMLAFGMACGFWIGRVHERDVQAINRAAAPAHGEQPKE